MAAISQTITVVPSGETGRTSLTTTSSYPVSNGYADSSSTSYARFSLSTSTAGYTYYTFDTSAIPPTATITSVTAKAKVRINSTGRVTDTNIQLYSGTTAKGSSSTYASTLSTNVVTLTPGTWTRSELSDLRIRIGATGGTSTQSKYIYFYGADVTITYTVQGYTVTTSGSGTLNPSGSTDLISGSSFTLTISDFASPTVTDNGTDVTGQLVESYDQTVSSVPNGYTNSGVSITNPTNCYNGVDNEDRYAQLTYQGLATGTVYLDMGDFSIPSGVTIKSVTAQAALMFDNGGSSSGFTSSIQMYTGTTAKGSATQWVSSSTSVARTIITMTPGMWTAAELADAKFYITATNSSQGTARNILIYGVTLSVTYESDEATYTYTISSVTADHTIVVSAGGSTTQALYRKVNGSWVEQNVAAVYVKSSGSWVSKSHWEEAFDTTKSYIWN